MADSRILVAVGKNSPKSRREFEKYPPVKFPATLHFLFTRREPTLKLELKAVLENLPKGTCRYKSTLNRYTGSISLKCYFTDMASLEFVARQVEGKNLWAGVLQEDQQVSSAQLILNAQPIFN